MLHLQSQPLAQTRSSAAHVGVTALKHATGAQRSQVATQAYVPNNTVSTSGEQLLLWTSGSPILYTEACKLQMDTQTFACRHHTCNLDVHPAGCAGSWAPPDPGGNIQPLRCVRAQHLHGT